MFNNNLLNLNQSFTLLTILNSTLQKRRYYKVRRIDTWQTGLNRSHLLTEGMTISSLIYIYDIFLYTWKNVEQKIDKIITLTLSATHYIFVGLKV